MSWLFRVAELRLFRQQLALAVRLRGQARVEAQREVEVLRLRHNLRQTFRNTVAW
jgi:hypothetical protein